MSNRRELDCAARELGSRRSECRHCGRPGCDGERGKAITAQLWADALSIVPAVVLAALSGALSRMLSREALRLRPGGSVLA